jgi:hypothetical protein
MSTLLTRDAETVTGAFADLLAQVVDAGVDIHAIATVFDPPAYDLRWTDLPVTLD